MRLTVTGWFRSAGYDDRDELNLVFKMIFGK